MEHLQNLKNKILDLPSLTDLVVQWKNTGDNIVFTNGCFDILHLGHVEYLSKAADLGSKLIVALNSDSSIRQLDKGANRPLQDENSRATIIAALGFVDAVTIFDDNNPYRTISAIIPDTLVKGGDYDASLTNKSDEKYIIGSDIVRSNGGNIKTIEFIKGYSTSKIEQKIKNSA